MSSKTFLSITINNFRKRQNYINWNGSYYDIVFSKYYFFLLAKILRITVKSVGCFDPPFHGNECEDTVGSIIVNGIELSQNKPGFNLVLLDYKTGEMEQAVNFDTHGRAGEYEKLEEFLSSLEMWKIVCIAVKNDAKNYLPQSALKSFVSSSIISCIFIIVFKVIFDSCSNSNSLFFFTIIKLVSSMFYCRRKSELQISFPNKSNIVPHMHLLD